MNAQEVLREIKKLCEQVDSECCEKEAVYKVGDVVKLCFSAACSQATSYYIIASAGLDDDGYRTGVYLLNLRTGIRHRRNSTRVVLHYAISQGEMYRMSNATVCGMSPSTLQEAAANI